MDNQPENNTAQNADADKPAVISPAEISAKLDEYVIGQVEAKKFLSVAVYNHYKRISYNDSGEGGVELSKSNILMIGPTGSGKTLLASTLARILDVPFAMADATALVAAGNIGREIEGILSKLISNAGNDVKKAERGIVYIDEIDKLAKKDFNRSAGEGVQQGLLKIIEKTVASINFMGKATQIDTGNMLFIVGGAFVGLDSLVRLRLGGTDAGMMDQTESLRHVSPEDLAKFGLIPEFIGRMPVIVNLQALDKEALSDALLKPKNSLVAQYKKMFALDGVELVFSDESIGKIAELALELKTGARGLRTIIEDRMLDIMYNVPNQKNLIRITVTPEVITKTGAPVYEYIESKDEPELVTATVIPPRPTSAYADI